MNNSQMTTVENQNVTLTDNGMVTNPTSLNKCVDLFFSIGSMRGKSKDKVVNLFNEAYNENPLVASKILFWVRDVRSGAGERQTFRDVISFLTTNSPQTVRKNIGLIPEFGRWDDVLVLLGTELEDDMFSLIKTALSNGDGLCAKWMPRKGVVANKLRKLFRTTPKQYRKMLVGLTNVVESKMCAKDWEKIDYSKLPSLASSRYQKSFNKNDNERYNEYKKSLQDGTAKVNAGAVYPYDIVKSMSMGGDNIVSEKQWESLPNWMEGSVERILPVVDVSGSMGVQVGGNPNLSCMDVAVSLGMYISERNEGSFKDAFITFSSNPQLQYLTGTLSERLLQLRRADWGMSTDLEAVFNLILHQAKMNNVSEGNMPTKILILSDMQFNQATRRDSLGAQSMIESMYEELGYTKPDIIYWNLNAKGGNFPVEFDKNGTALVSGFSPSILKSLLGGKNMTPESIMMDTVNDDRYSVVTV
ncbi:MAG: DUF2828 family protein [Gammaproteobacteria bacterium]|nr:DUF2828 family protein [Gammaproteobacteria bacterium]